MKPVTKKEIEAARKAYNRKLKEAKENNRYLKQMQLFVLACFLISPISYFWEDNDAAFKRVATVAIALAILSVLKAGIYFVKKMEVNRLGDKHDDLLALRALAKNPFLQEMELTKDPRFGVEVHVIDGRDFKRENARDEERYNQDIHATVKMFSDAGIEEDKARIVVLSVINETPYELSDIAFMLNMPCPHKLTPELFVEHSAYIIEKAKAGAHPHTIAAAVQGRDILKNEDNAENKEN